MYALWLPFIVVIDIQSSKCFFLFAISKFLIPIWIIEWV